MNVQIRSVSARQMEGGSLLWLALFDYMCQLLWLHASGQTIDLRKTVIIFWSAFFFFSCLVTSVGSLITPSLILWGKTCTWYIFDNNVQFSRKILVLLMNLLVACVNSKGGNFLVLTLNCMSVSCSHWKLACVKFIINCTRHLFLWIFF